MGAIDNNNNKTDKPAQLSISFDNCDWTEDAKVEAIQEKSPAPRSKREKMYFISFGSGSSGNSCYVGTDDYGVIIDAGIDADKVFESLADNGVKPEKVKAIILTHDHGDHIKFAYTIARKYKHIRIYCTPRLMNGLLRRHNVSRRIKDYHEQIFKEIPFKIAGFTITAFNVSHDGSDNMGFIVEHDGRSFVVSPDQGVITDRARHYMEQANYLMIESNYDRSMLDNGTYPEYLKNRVRGENGHLDNQVTAKFLADSYTENLKYVFLCHLSNDNNTPDVARSASTKALEAKGVSVGDGSNSIEHRDKDLQLVILPRFESSAWFTFDD